MRKLTNQELCRIDVQTFKNSEKTPIIIVLDDVRSLNNIGSVFRTCDAFRIKKIYLCGITACPPHKDIHKTALGATESVDWEYVADIEELTKKLQQENIQVWAVEQTEKSTFLHHFSPETKQKYALIFGNEVKGVRQSVVSQANGVIEIPQLGTKHSLNISVSVGIVIWDIATKILSFSK